MKIFRNLFNTEAPQELGQNKRQVALNIVPAAIIDSEGKEVTGFNYDIIAFDESDYNYTDNIKVDVAKLFEAKDYLESTDFKMTSDYDEDVTEIKAIREAKRALIREIEG